MRKENNSHSYVTDLVKLIEDLQVVNSLTKVTKILKNLEESGILDILEVLSNKEIIERAYPLIVNTGSLRLMDRINGFLDLIADVLEVLESREEPANLRDILRSLGDPEVRTGIIKVIKILKILGRSQ